MESSRVPPAALPPPPTLPYVTVVTPASFINQKLLKLLLATDALEKVGVISRSSSPSYEIPSTLYLL